MNDRGEPDPRQSPEPLRDQRIESPHERVINQTLQQIDATSALLVAHLPHEITRHLKLHTLVRLPPA